MSLTASDLKILFDLVTRAPLTVASVVGVWPSVQRLEQASRAGVDLQPVAAEVAEVDGNR